MSYVFYRNMKWCLYNSEEQRILFWNCLKVYKDRWVNIIIVNYYNNKLVLEKKTLSTELKCTRHQVKVNFKVKMYVKLHKREKKSKWNWTSSPWMLYLYSHTQEQIQKGLKERQKEGQEIQNTSQFFSIFFLQIYSI